MGSYLNIVVGVRDEDAHHAALMKREHVARREEVTSVRRGQTVNLENDKIRFTEDKINKI